MKRRISCIIALVYIVVMLPLFSSSATYATLTDTTGISDADFFGVWNNTSSKWTTSPQLDYAKVTGLSAVENAAKKGDYTLAKEELLKYYKNRTSIKYPQSPYAPATYNYIYWAMNDAMTYKDEYIADININSTSFKEYTINLGTNANSGMFHLSSLTKTSDMIEIYSRESSYAPKLVITKTNGSTITLNPQKDTYIRGGTYGSTNYGNSQYLYVKDDYTLSNGKYIPYSNNSRRSYIFFDNNSIPSSGISSVKLVITARIKAESGSTTNSSINLVVINPYNKSWAETSAQGSLLPMTWDNYKIDHFSWKGLPGGIVWEKPENSQTEFLNSNTRFTQIAALISKANSTGENKYMYKSFELILDFIGESIDEISNGVPNKRDIESANRCYLFGSMYKFYLNSEFMNADVNAALLKWLVKESLYLYNGAGVLYNGATDDVRENNFAYTNRGAWHCAGLLSSLAYFPELKGSDDWEIVLNKRLKKNVDYLIAEDGAYLEGTFGYSENVIKHYNAMLETWENTGRQPLAGLDEKLLYLGKYLMYVGYPDGLAPKWGDNSGSSKTMISKIDNYADDPELLYYMTDGKKGVEPAKKAEKFDSLKVVTSRTGWSKNDSMLFINALTAGNHKHRDALAITLYHGGKEILEDTGTSSYDNTYPSFAWQRSATRSHNTIEIDTTAQTTKNNIADGAPSDIDLNANDEADMITAWTDATTGFRHYRNLLWVKGLDLLVVNDMVKPGDTLTHKYTQNWHTNAVYTSNASIDAKTYTGKTNYSSGTNLIIAQADTTNLTAKLLDGYSAVSSNLTKYFSYEKNVSGNVNFATALVPVSSGNSVSVSASKLNVTGTGAAQAMKTTITKNDVESNVISFTAFEHDGTEHTFDGYTTDAEGAYIVTDSNGNLISGGLYNGSFIKHGNKTILSTSCSVSNATFSINDGVININCADAGADATFVVDGYPDIYGATINDNIVDVVKSDSTLYVNYSIPEDSDLSGSMPDKTFLWSYDSDNKVLSVYGGGALSAYTSSDYTQRPWQSFCNDIKYLIISNAITSVDAYTFSNMTSLSKVWCPDSFFNVSGNTYTIDNKFAGNTTYICSASTAKCSGNKFSWSYKPEFTSEGISGNVDVVASDKTSELTTVTSGSWNHLDYNSMRVIGAKSIKTNLSTPELKTVTILGQTAVGENAFKNSDSLSSVVMSEGVYSVADGAFANASGGCEIDIVMPSSITSVSSSAFSGRPNSSVTINGYLGSVAQTYASTQNYTFKQITSGEQKGMYSWKYDVDNKHLYIDMYGTIPSKLSDRCTYITSNYEPYIKSATILSLGKNVEKVPNGIFDGGNITKVYCPYNLFNLTYERQSTKTDSDIQYKDESGVTQIYPATVTINGKTVPTHNAKITAAVSSNFAGSGATYKPGCGEFNVYTRTSSPYTIEQSGLFDWNFDPVSGLLTINCIYGDELGNTSIRDRSYYPWSSISSEIKAVKFEGEQFESIGKLAFSTAALEKINIPKHIKNISMRTFYNCTNLKEVNVEYGLEHIGEYAFRKCTALKTIFLPESVTNIGKNTFYEDTDTLIICYAGTTPATKDLYVSSSELNSKRILSKISYADSTITIIGGSDNTDKLIKAYYKYDKNEVPVLEKIVASDASLNKNKAINITDELSDIDCDYVKIMLILSDLSMCPASNVVTVTK